MLSRSPDDKHIHIRQGVPRDAVLRATMSRLHYALLAGLRGKITKNNRYTEPKYNSHRLESRRIFDYLSLFLCNLQEFTQLLKLREKTQFSPLKQIVYFSWQVAI